MAENTSIEWADHTFNPWEGCQKVGPGCDNCYAEARNARFGGGQAINWGPDAPRRRTSAANWRKPLQWNAQAEREGRRYRVFCASLADVFDNQVPAEWRADLFKLIADTSHLDWLLLTKRIGNVARMIPFGWQDFGMPPHIWLGATVVNQEEADRDIPKLLAVPARVRFLSIEPMLSAIDLDCLDVGESTLDALRGHTEHREFNERIECGRIDWVIAGGESGPKARPAHPDWFRSLEMQCRAAGAPFFMKQMGGTRDKRGALEDLPDDLRVREFPHA